MTLGSILMIFGFIVNDVKLYELIIWLTMNIIWAYPIDISYKELEKREKLKQRKKSIWWNC